MISGSMRQTQRGRHEAFMSSSSRFLRRQVLYRCVCVRTWQGPSWQQVHNVCLLGWKQAEFIRSLFVRPSLSFPNDHSSRPTCIRSSLITCSKASWSSCLWCLAWPSPCGRLTWRQDRHSLLPPLDLHEPHAWDCPSTGIKRERETNRHCDIDHLSPKAELAAKQLDLKVIGWYQANARNKDNALHENAVRVANVIKKNSGDAIVFMVGGMMSLCVVMMDHWHTRRRWTMIRWDNCMISRMAVSFR